ncbi:MAG: STAS domain-containing protein [Capsulimonas sp.]|uniref:STAS domain-containing protein n=1 Tax=Capsulimonas sp. TaxID=2494211 RepID=UPI003264823B
MSIIQRLLGRVLLLRCDGPLDGMGLSAQEVLDRVRVSGARVVLVDVTQAPYVDSNGIRWLLKLQSFLEETGRHLRIAAKRGAGVWRILTMMGPVTRRLEIFEGISGAWKAKPAQGAPAAQS